MEPRTRQTGRWQGLAVVLVLLAVAGVARAAAGHDRTAECPLWFWPAVLFVVSLAIGLIAVPAGVGGGVLFVPVVSAFMPFHLDFVRCAGLLIALAGSVAAGPALLRKNLASLHVAMPMVLVASAASIAGALLGLALPPASCRSPWAS